MILSEGQILTQNFEFIGHISTFQAENTLKSGSFKAKNNAQTTSEQLQTNFQKVKKTYFWSGKLSKWPSQRAKFWTILILEVIYRPKNEPFNAKNNTYITSEQLQNNFQKVQKNDFFDPENGQNDPLRGPYFDLQI